MLNANLPGKKTLLKSKTHRRRADELVSNRRNFPLSCPKCRQESLIDAKDLRITVIKGLEAKTQN